MGRTRAATAVVAAILVAGALGGCGGGDDAPPPTTTTEPPTTTVTIPQGDAKGIACLRLATEALSLLNDYRLASRGVVGPPDPAPYRESADALRAEHARLECPGDLLKGFPAG